MRRRTERSIGNLLIAALLSGCDTHEPPPHTRVDTFLLQQAVGVELGMTWRELVKVRPGVQREDGMVYESSPEGQNQYFFRRSDGTSGMGSTTGRLAAVRMYPPARSDDSEIARRIANVRSQWSHHAGPAQDSTSGEISYPNDDGQRTSHTLIWVVENIELRLQYHVVEDGEGARPSRAMVAIVAEKGLED